MLIPFSLNMLISMLPLGRADGFPLVCLAAFLFAGCEIISGTPRIQSEAVASSCEGRPMEYQVLGGGSQAIFILATIHGNESAGTPLVQKLREYLMEHPGILSGRRVLLMPIVNVDGLARRTRYNLRGIDLNRNFPARNHRADQRSGHRPLSEPESRAIAGLLRKYWPVRIVTIHQPLECIDYDGPALDLAKSMSRLSGLPLKKLGSMPGSLGSYAGEDLDIPTVTVELPAGAHHLPPEELWTRYGTMMLRAISYPTPEEI